MVCEDTSPTLAPTSEPYKDWPTIALIHQPKSFWTSAHKVEVSTPKGTPIYLDFMGTESSDPQALKVDLRISTSTL